MVIFVSFYELPNISSGLIKGDNNMMNMKTLVVCGMMLLPSLSQAQSCCQGKKEKKCDKQETMACCQMGNEVIQTIMSRRSVRKYLDKPVEHEKLETASLWQ